MERNYTIESVDPTPWFGDEGVHSWDPETRVLQITHLLTCLYHSPRSGHVSVTGRIKSQLWIPQIDISEEHIKMAGVFVSSSPDTTPDTHLSSLEKTEYGWAHHHRENMLHHTKGFYYNKFYEFCHGRDEDYVLSSLYAVTQISTNLFEITNVMERNPNMYIPLIMFDEIRVPHIISVCIDKYCLLTDDTYLGDSTEAFKEFERYKLALNLMV